MSILRDISNIEMLYTRSDHAPTMLSDVDFKINKGEFVSLIGLSDQPQSTVLNTLAERYLKKQTELTTKQASQAVLDTSIVLQHNALLPWLTVYQNIELAVEQKFAKTLSKPDKKKRIKHTLKLVNMVNIKHKRPNELAIEMKQRVAIARALAIQPEVLLLDNPFVALDASAKANIQHCLMEIQEALNNTILMVTQDVEQALLLSDKIIMMANESSLTVTNKVNINLPKPRNAASLSDNNDYKRLKSELICALGGKVASFGTHPVNNIMEA